jgi:hypothetical protein
MRATRVLGAFVPSEMKRRVHELAEQQFITESVWLRQVVAAALRDAAPNDTTAMCPVPTVHTAHRNDVAAAGGKGRREVCMSVRLRPEDRLLLQERAEARSMQPSTYVSVLVRAHLRHLAPLPKDELLALKQCIAELGAIARNLNARAANSAGHGAGPAREDLLAMLKVCEAVRANVKALIKANVNAWEVGHAKSES